MPKMTLSLPDKEWAFLEEVCKAASKSKTTVIRDALSHYLVLSWMSDTKLYLENKAGERTELHVPKVSR